MRWLWVACFVAACGSAMPALPSQGGAAWYEIASPHVDLFTDASPARGQALVQEMESYRAIVVRGLNHAQTEARIVAVALGSTSEARAFLPSQAAAIANPFGASMQPILLVDANGADDERSTVFTHELTHAVAHGIVHHQPSWLAEGIAVFFENARSHGGSVQVGVPSEGRLDPLRSRGLLPTETLFECNAVVGNCDVSAFYATAWAMFSFLVTEHFDDLARYLKRLDELPPARADQAWREVFPALPPGPELDHALHEFVTFGHPAVMRFDVPDVHVTPTVQHVSDAQVAALRAVARLTFKGDKAGALADANAAIASDATNVDATLVRFHLEGGTVTPAAAQAVAAAHPTDWRAWWLVARVAPAPTSPTPPRRCAPRQPRIRALRSIHSCARRPRASR